MQFADPHDDPNAYANELGISSEAMSLYLASDVIDLHLDSFIWTRIFGYNLHKKHNLGLFGRAFYSHCDFPRALEAGLTGATWIITTNPFLPSRVRTPLFVKNLARLKRELANASSHYRHVRTAAEYRAARAEGLHGAFIGIQGGNALSHHRDDLDHLKDGDVLRVTLVHLSNSNLGVTSSPASRLGGRDGLTSLGRDYVRRLNEKKIFVDLAHISRRGFFDAVEVHDKSQPLIVTHTGIAGVYEHWRNITDEQMRAVADTGGTIGVMFQASFLGKRGVTASHIIDHIEHIIETVGEDHASIGTDYDGAIVPPPDIPTPREMPKLVELMLRRGWSSERIGKILGGNVLRAVELLRG